MVMSDVQVMQVVAHTLRLVLCIVSAHTVATTVFALQIVVIAILIHSLVAPEECRSAQTQESVWQILPIVKFFQKPTDVQVHFQSSVPTAIARPSQAIVTWVLLELVLKLNLFSVEMDNALLCVIQEQRAHLVSQQDVQMELALLLQLNATLTMVAMEHILIVVWMVHVRNKQQQHKTQTLVLCLFFAQPV
jgi:hypothetical protein